MVHRWSCVLLCFVGGLIAFVSGPASLRGAEPAPSVIAICGAYQPEITALREEFGANTKNGFTETKIKGITFWRGRYGRHEVVLFRAGASIVNATYQLQVALERFSVKAVLFAGVAGGTDPALQVGDVVIPEKWAYHDESVYLNPDGKGGYVVPRSRSPRYENFGMMFPEDVGGLREGESHYRPQPTFAADKDLLAAARRAIPKLPPLTKRGRPVTVNVGGTGVSGSVFVDNAEYREWLFRVWKARCTDMESTALAHVAWANETPILIVRSVSDLAGAQRGKNPIDANEKSVAEIAARVLRQVVDEL